MSKKSKQALLLAHAIHQKDAQALGAMCSEHGGQQLIDLFMNATDAHRTIMELTGPNEGACQEELSPEQMFANLLLDHASGGALATTMLSELAEHGWTPSQPQLAALEEAACSILSLPMFQWLADMRFPLAPRPATEDHFHSPLLPAIRAKKELGEEALGRLCDAGLLQDSPGAIGLTDFLIDGQIKAARALAAKGFQARPQTLSVGMAAVGMNPACAYIYANTQCCRGLAESEVFDLLAARGACFRASEQRPPNKGQPNPAMIDPLYALARTRGVRAHQSAFFPLAQSLIGHGANPNLTGHYLAEEVALMAQGAMIDSAYFDFAIRLGADLASRPGPSIAALARWTIPALDQNREAWLDKLISMGALPELVENSCARNSHPMAAAVSLKNYSFARLLLDRGFSPAWSDHSTGATVLHFLAEDSSPEAHGLLRRMLRRQDMKDMIDQRCADREDSRWSLNGWSRNGATALILACSAESKGQAQALLDAGADPNASNESGNAALHCVGGEREMEPGRALWIMKLLIDSGADLSKTNGKGETAAQAMISRAPLDVAAELISLRLQDFTGNSAASVRAAKTINAQGPQARGMLERAILESHAPPPSSPGASSPKIRL